LLQKGGGEEKTGRRTPATGGGNDSVKRAKRLMERLEQSKREGHSRAPTPPPHQSGTRAVAQTVPHTSLVQQTHQSVRQVIPNRVVNPRGHPFTYDIIVTPLPQQMERSNHEPL